MTNVKIVTWNILAQRYWNDSNMEWNCRLEIIVKKLFELNCDIICLQEVELETAADDFDLLFDCYDYAIHKVTKKRNSCIGNLTMWKKNTFTLDTCEYNSTGVHTLLVHNELSKKAWVSNVHLRAGLRSQENERVRQLTSTLNLLLNVNLPCCIIGDFNDELVSDGKLYELLTKYNFVKRESPKSCNAKNSFFKFDRAITTLDLKMRCNNTPKLVSIPNKKCPSDHFWIEYIITF